MLSVKDIREICSELIHFYDNERIGSALMRSPDEVNMIFGVPIGEPNPTNEGNINGGTHGMKGIKRKNEIGTIRLPDPRSVVDLPTQMNTIEGFTNVSDNISSKF